MARYCVGPAMATDWEEEVSVEIDRHLIGRAFSYFLPYWRRGVLSVAAIAVGAVLGLAPALIAKKLIDHLSAGDTTFSYVDGRPHAPKGAAWEKALDHWRSLTTDAGAGFDGEIDLDATKLEPHVTWGTTPAQVVPVTGRVPSPRSETDERALRYMDLLPGTALADIAIDRVFIGSCTNARLEDLRAAAGVIQGRHVHPKVRAMVVPGSTSVKRAAEEEGLDLVFKAAGFEWRNAGCSMCLGMNPDILAPGERCASTSNRNFEGRQGSGGRTHLMSPPMAAAAAITGHLVDVRELL